MEATMKTTAKHKVRKAFVQGLKDGPRLAVAPLRGAIKGALRELRREAKRVA